MQDPFDRLFRDIHKTGIRGDRFSIAYGLAEPDQPSKPDDEPWAHDPWGQEQSMWATIAGLLGISFAAVFGYFPLGFTIFVAPLPVTLVVYGLWIVQVRLTSKQRTTHPWRALAIPLVFVTAWGVMMWIGWTLLHWPPLSMPGLT